MLCGLCKRPSDETIKDIADYLKSSKQNETKENLRMSPYIYHSAVTNKVLTDLFLLYWKGLHNTVLILCHFISLTSRYNGLVNTNG